MNRAQNNIVIGTELAIHPAAQIFPLMTHEAYESFKADIAANGLREPICLYQAQILDGRNRHNACIDLGIEPKYYEYTGDDPVAFVWSHNGARRQLTKNQMAIIAVRMLPPLQAEAKKRQVRSGEEYGRGKVPPNPAEPIATSSGEATLQAAQIVGIGKTMVYEAKKVIDEAPHLVEDIESGKLTVNKARRIMRGKNVEPDPNAPRQPAAKRAKTIARLSAEGYRANQIAEEMGICEAQVRKIARRFSVLLPDAVIGQMRHINCNRVIETTVNGLSGYAQGLGLIKGDLEKLDTTQVPGWITSITESMKSIHWLRKTLKERSVG